MFGSISLIHGFLPPLVVALALASLVLLVRLRGGAWKRQLLISIPVTAALIGIAALLVDGLALIPYQFPNSYYLWFGLVVFSVVLSIAGWRSISIGRAALSGVSLVLTVSMAVMLVNAHYQYYPNLRSVFGPGAHRVTSQQVAATAASDRLASQAQLRESRLELAGDNPVASTLGATIQVPIPGTKSGFSARDAYVWLPPVWFTHPSRKLPVVELLAGVPGGPSDWTRAGFADKTASKFAQTHGGLAPILVMPDSNGAEGTDTECVDSPLGNAGTYLTEDVPAYVRSTFDTSDAPGSLAIAGLSAGGMCATMLALTHPRVYSTFADYAGLTSPTVGETVDPAATVRDLFGGSVATYDAHDPLHLLAANRYPGMAAWFEVGTADGAPLAAERQLVPLARAAGIDTHADEIPGAGHNFDLFSRAFADSLPFLSYRLGLTADPLS